MPDKLEGEYDVRVLEHMLRRGLVSQKQVDAYLSTVPDSADNADETEVKFEATAARRMAEQQ
jgi:hypothetical protein